MKWFKHDSNAHRDAKIKRLKHQYGIIGYGVYWYCIELIAESIDKNNVTFELEEDASLIALEWNLDQLKVQEIMIFMVEIGLFENENGAITCFKLAKRMDDTNARNPEIKQILTKMVGVSRRKSEKVGESPRVSEQTRLDKTRSDNKDQDILATSEKPDDDDPPTKNKTPIKEIVKLYHKLLPTLPRVEKLTKTREGYLKQRWREDLQDINQWENFFHFVSESPFLMGKIESYDNRPPFMANLEWITKPSNFAKIAEDKYHG